ncbi:MAG: hypothetical protein QNL62_01715 [Gammaproteobacteria bacterium]|nr:hypothetical protein [Gammaproteobacteria bacterium]
MKIAKHTIYFALRAILAMCILTSALAMADESVRIRCKNSHYYSPTAEELDKAESLFHNFLSFRQNKADAEQFKMLDLSLSFESLQQLNYSMLTEFQANCHGRGSYVVKHKNNHKSNNKVMIQSPHIFYDTYTGEIAEQIFATGHIYAAAWNSVSRKARSIGNYGNYGNADLSRSTDSYLMRFSLAFAKSENKARIVQLHGFSQKKRKTAPGRRADVIISNGTKKSSDDSRKLQQCLKKQFVEQYVFLFPYDVRELGATGNSIGKQLRIIGFNGFIHVEMSYAFRKELKNNPLKLEKFAQCLSEI